MLPACFGFLAMCMLQVVLVSTASATDGDATVANFLEHASKSGKLNGDKLKELRDAVMASSKDSVDSAITEGLMRLYPDYRAAVQASDADDLSASLTKLSGLTSSDDKFLAADASFYLARALMNNERFEEALPLLKELNASLADFSAHAASNQYYLGLAHAGMLENDEAVRCLMEFLQFNPDAPERLRVSAWRQIQQMQSIDQGQMDDVYQRMDYSRRRLEIVESGDRTQVEQNNVVKMLAKLIKEQEKKECSNCSGKSKCQSPSEGESQKQAKKDPQEKSESQKGGQSNVANGKYVEKAFDTGNASPWSRLRDRSRDPANTAIKDKLPARYREIVERYYDAVNGNDSADANKSGDNK